MTLALFSARGALVWQRQVRIGEATICACPSVGVWFLRVGGITVKIVSLHEQ